jgi:phage terminase large subunit-like protein
MTLEAAGRWYTDRLTLAAQRGADVHDEALRWLGRNDLFFLLTVLLGRRDLKHPWLFARCREVQGSPDGHLDLWAREHYKSTIITFALTIQDILKDPEETFGIFSHTRDIAKYFLTQIMRELGNNEMLKGLYPDVLYQNPKRESPKWSEDDGIVVKRKANPKESTVEAWGLVDGQPTGKHFRTRIYDDVVTMSSVGTPAQIRKTTIAWEMSDNLGARGGRVRYIGTRYAMFDTYSTMLERQVVTTRIYPATDNGRLDGNPVLLTPEAWEEKKRTQRSVIAAQMLQNPLSGEDQTFEAAWLLAYELRPRLMNVVILVDPSKGRSAKSDRTAIAVVGIAHRGTKYLLDGFCHRMRLSERWTAVRDLHRKWARMPGCTVVGVGYERYGQQSDDEYFEERMRVENYPFALTELNWTADSSRSKDTRIARLEPDFRLGRFYLPVPVWRRGIGAATWRVDDGEVKYERLKAVSAVQRDALARGDKDLLARAIKRADENDEIYDLTIRFIEEFVDHPYGQHDDLVDAVSRVYDMEVVAPVLPVRDDVPAYWDS